MTADCSTDTSGLESRSTWRPSGLLIATRTRNLSHEQRLTPPHDSSTTLFWLCPEMCTSSEDLQQQAIDTCSHTVSTDNIVIIKTAIYLLVNNKPVSVYESQTQKLLLKVQSLILRVQG
eukprot:scpid85792/ scgid33506/ 